MRRPLLTGLLVFSGCATPVHDRPAAPATPAAAPMTMPRYTPGGDLLRPEGYRDWTFVGASIGLSYSEGSQEGSRLEKPGVFHNVYTQPQAVAQYAATGNFPEGTTFILALHEPKQKESINRQGYFEGDLVAVEASVKDHARFPEGWAYFDFGKGGRKESATAMPPASCHACHAEHAADDNVFVQFYPALRPILEARKAAMATEAEKTSTINEGRAP